MTADSTPSPQDPIVSRYSALARTAMAGGAIADCDPDVFADGRFGAAQYADADEVPFAAQVEMIRREEDLAHAWELDARSHVVGLLGPVSEVGGAGDDRSRAVGIEHEAVHVHPAPRRDLARGDVAAACRLASPSEATLWRSGSAGGS